MTRTLNAIAAIALFASGGVALADINDCDVEVTHTRVAEENACYARHGPQSADFDVRSTLELDSCLEQVQSRFKIKRWLCHDVSFRNVDYDKLL